MLLKYILLAITTLSSIACSRSSNYFDDNAANQIRNSIVDREWILTQYGNSDGTEIDFLEARDFNFSIRFSSGSETISGINVCNNYSGTFSLEESTLSVYNIEMDGTACEKATDQPTSLVNRVLFTTGNPPILSVLNNRLVASSGNNERVFFTDKATLGLTFLQGGDLASLGHITFPEPRYRFFQNQQQFRELYEGLQQYHQTTSGLPQINFDETTVLFVAHEIVSSGGYTIEIVSIEKIENRLIVGVQKYAPGGNCAVTTAFTGPYLIYTVDGIFDQIEFFEKPIISQLCS